MKRLLRQFALFSALIIAFAACKDDDTNNSDQLNAQDQNFLTSAAYSNRAEISLGQLAITRATNDSVLMFAQHMINDHTSGLAGLDTLSRRYGYNLPDGLDTAHTNIRNMLSTLSGRAFDSAYMRSQVMDHQTALTLYQNQATNGGKQDIKDFAQRNVPLLQQHYMMAQSIYDSLQ